MTFFVLKPTLANELADDVETRQSFYNIQNIPRISAYICGVAVDHRVPPLLDDRPLAYSRIFVISARVYTFRPSVKWSRIGRHYRKRIMYVCAHDCMHTVATDRIANVHWESWDERLRISRWRWTKRIWCLVRAVMKPVGCRLEKRLVDTFGSGVWVRIIKRGIEDHARDHYQLITWSGNTLPKSFQNQF